MKRVDEYAEMVAQMVTDDKERDNLYRKIDEAIECQFTPSEEVTSLPWVKNRHYGMTNLADARNVGARTFSTLLPKIEILPNDDTLEEYARVETSEQLWEWEMERMNHVQKGKGVHDKIVESAVTYHAVAMQTQYLPYVFRGEKKSQRIKSLLARKNFNWSVHHPGTVHSHCSDYGDLVRVAKVVSMTAQQLIDNFPNNPATAKLKAKYPKSTKAELMKEQYTLVDVMDWDYRLKWAYEGTGPVVKSDIVFMDEEHELPFLPWVVVDYGDPLWKSVINSGLWENMQYANLIMFSKAIEQSTRSTLVIRTPDGTLQNVWIDFTNPSNPIVIPPGADIQDLSPAPIDPQLSLQFEKMVASVSSSTVAQVLTQLGQYENAPFSTVEKIVQLALGQLSPAKKTAEATEVEGIYQGYQWIEHSNIPLIGYRKEAANSVNGYKRGKGQAMGLFPGEAPKLEEGEEPDINRVYYDLENLYINVELQSSNVADEQSRLNLMINAMDRGLRSRQSASEFMGWKNYELEQAQIDRETVRDADRQAKSQQLMGMAQLQVQRAGMEMQQQAMQQEQQMALENQQAQMNAGSQFQGLQGRDMRGGMQPAAQVAPFETREQVAGETAEGLPMV